MQREQNKKYAAEYEEIAAHILKYSRASAFSMAMHYLSIQDKPNDNNLKLQNAQWLIFILIKISSASVGVLKMNDADFVRICNRLFRLQDHLINVNSPNILLAFRPLIYQQSLLRKNIPECMMSLARQCKILGGNDFYEKTFLEITGVGVASFFTLWLNLLVQATAKKGDEAFEVNVIDLLYRVQKVVALKEVVNFFVFFGVRYSYLPEYFKKFSGSAGTVDDYYYDTPLKKKPFLLSNKKIYIFSEKLLLSCFPLLLIQTIKDARIENAKSKLGADIEEYVGELLARTGLKIHSEEDLKTVYRNNQIALRGAKVTDFAIDSKSVVLLESKAIEQTDWLKVNTDPAELKSRLDQDFIKAVIQAEKCALYLSRTKEFEGRDFKAIIVTYDDFGISTAASIKQLINVDIEEEIRIECGGELTIPLGNIVYIPIIDFEALSVALRDKLINIDEVIDECFQDQSFNAGMSLRKVITDKCGYDIYKQADELLTTDDKFIMQLVRFSHSGQALNVQNAQAIMSMHSEVMYAINHFSEIRESANV